MKKIFIVFVTAVLLVCAGCDQATNIQNNDEPININDIQVPEDFTYQTSSAVAVNLTVTDASDNPVQGVVFKIYDADPDQNGRLTSKGVTLEDGSYKTALIVPEGCNALTVVSPMNTLSVPIINGELHYEYEGYTYLHPDTNDPSIKPGNIATTRYVSPSGSNTPPYTNLITAATSIQTAINVSSDGDIILVDNGTYTLTTKITITIGITVESIYGSALAIVDGNNVTKCFEIDHAEAMVNGFTIQNGYHPEGFGGAVNIKNGGTVRRCILKDSQARDGGGAAIDTDGLLLNCIVKDNLASDNGTSGYGGGVRLLNGGEIRNCEITGNISIIYGGGVNIWNAGTVYNCVIANNASPVGAGIHTRNNSQIYNTIIYYNTGSDNYTVSGSGYHYYNCCLTPAIPASYSTNCISSVPMFVSTIGGSEDYRLQAGSPCINAGLNAGWMAWTYDLDENMRITNGIVDMGPYESFTAPSDADGDGVPNDEDDYPDDPDRAFDNFFPAENTYYTLAFEDKWPRKSDYDFNDIVVDWNYTQVTNASNELVDIIGSFKLRAIGAGYHNGCGVQFPFAISNYSAFEDNGDAHQYVDNGTTNAVVILFEDAFDLMQEPGGDPSTWINTVESEPYVTPAEFEFTYTLDTPLDFSAWSSEDLPPYNPFIYVNNDRQKEIHLADYAPTSKMAGSPHWGTYDDDSDPDTGRYFKTSNNLPWAINVATSWDYPIEICQITHAYLFFAAWAESGGEVHENWYDSSEPTNINAANIYSP